MTRTAPARVRSEAKLGLELHKKWKRGGTAVGVARAVQLSSGKAVSDATIKRMYSYFQRHQHDRLDKDGSDGSIPGRGYIAWLLWGGNSGRKWAEGEYKKIQGKKKNPISKPVKKIKEDLAKKTIYLIKVSLDDYRSEAWAQEMVTKEEDFEVVDNYDGNGEPIFKTSEYVLAVVPKKYLQDFEFLRRMQLEGKLEKHSFTSAARAWLENDQPLDWFNEQAQDRGYLTKDEYLFLVKVNNPTISESLEERKKYFIELARECQSKPKRDTKDGRQLHTFLITDENFKAKIKELCPQWFRGDRGKEKETLELMEYIRELAKNGAPRPSQHSKDPDEKKIANDIASLFARYPKLRAEILALRPDWFFAGERKKFAEYKEENPLKMSNPARNVANVEDVKKFCEEALEEFDEALGYNADEQKYLNTNMPKWFRSNLFKGIMNSDRTQGFFKDLNEDNYEDVYFEHTGNYEWPDFVEKSIKEGKKIEFFYPRNGRYFIDFSMDHFADFFESGDFPANPSRVSYDQMIQLVLDWDKKDVKVSDETKIAEGEVVFKEYSDGMKWVLLTNKQAIENESRISRMGHCIGRTNRGQTSNWYIDKVVDGIAYAFSLRDKENHPYVTCFYEFMENSEEDTTKIGLFTQIKGYKNCHINTVAYHQVDKKDRIGIQDLSCRDLPQVNSNEKYVIDLIKDKKIEKLTRRKHNTNFTAECDDLFENADFVSFKILTNYAEVDIFDGFDEYLERKILTNEQFERFDLRKLNLPNAAIFDLKFNSKTKLPDNLIIFAPTGFETLDLKALPSNLKIIGNLSLDLPLTNVGNNIVVEGDLLFRDDLNKSHRVFADKIDARNKMPYYLAHKASVKRNPLQLIARGIDPRPVSKYEREELKLGIKTELEHTDEAVIASKIAKDHLDEDPHYYSKLVEMERGMKKSNPKYFLGNPIKLFNKSIRFEVDARTLERSILPYLLLSEIKKNSPNGILALRLKDSVIERLERVFPSEEIGESKPFEFHVSVLYPMIEYFEKRKYISRIGANPYCITDFGDKTLQNWANTISKINQFIEMEKGMKKSNPITPASEEYLPIVEDSIAGETNGLTAWIDETTGDILVGWMAFEEDRSFDDVIARIKPSGRILEGDSVDDSIRKDTHRLMKKIHNGLVNYVTHKKSNPSPAEEISLDKIEELILDSVDQALSHEYDIYNKDRRTDEYDKQKWLKKIRELWAKAVKWKIIYRKKWFENTPIDDGKLEDLQDRIDDKFQKWDRRGLKGTTNLWNNRGIETDKIIRNSRKSNPSNNVESLKKDFDKILRGEENE